MAPETEQAGRDSLQTDMVRPVELKCEHCHRSLAVSSEAPGIRLLS
ncbi:hypothetical protein [Nonomuraea sp. NPDC050691]